jgi:DNA-binding LacI/PurR family transcriptional regulator
MDPITSPSLRYRSLADELRLELLNSEFRAGDRFPSIRNLISKTGRSLPTVRSALNILVEEGLLERTPRSGYFVTALGARQAANQTIRLAVVTPVFSAPTEPWFTGRIISGIVNAAAQNYASVAIIQRRQPPDARMHYHPDDIERINAEKADGLIWLHYGRGEESILERLTTSGMPVATTMRHWPGRRSFMIREDDWLFAVQVITSFQTLGHKAIGMVLHLLEDEYYASKFSCLVEVGNRMGIKIDRSTCFIFKESLDLEADTVTDHFDTFIQDHPEVTGYVILDSMGLGPIDHLWRRAGADHPVKKISFLLNVLDGDNILTLPLSRDITSISPPLEMMGERIVTELIHRINGSPLPKYTPLIPQLRLGKTMMPPQK